MNRKELAEKYGVDKENVVEKLAKNSLYGEQCMSVNESYFNQPMPRTSLRERRRRKGTPVSCFVCGARSEMLYKTDDGYICRTCRRKRDFI